MMKKIDNPHHGQDFDDFLGEEELLSDAEATANKRVFAFQVEQQTSNHDATQPPLSQSDKNP